MTATTTRTATARAPGREGGAERMLGMMRTVRTTIVRAVARTVRSSRTKRTSSSQSGLPGSSRPALLSPRATLLLRREHP